MAEWFQYQSQTGFVWVRWLPRSPASRASTCDRCHRRVMPDEPRLQVDNDKGPQRQRGKGKYHQYLCTDCAKKVPNHPDTHVQEEMF